MEKLTDKVQIILLQIYLKSCEEQQAQLRLWTLGSGTVLIFYMSLAPLQYKYKDMP